MCVYRFPGGVRLGLGTSQLMSSEAQYLYWWAQQQISLIVSLYSAVLSFVVRCLRC